LIFLRIQKKDFLVLLDHRVLLVEMAKTGNRAIEVILVDLASLVILV
jgi:hypothetical protein